MERRYLVTWEAEGKKGTIKATTKRKVNILSMINQIAKIHNVDKDTIILLNLHEMKKYETWE